MTDLLILAHGVRVAHRMGLTALRDELRDALLTELLAVSSDDRQDTP